MAVVLRSRSVLSFISYTKSKVFQDSKAYFCEHRLEEHLKKMPLQVNRRYSSYSNSPLVETFKENYNYEVVKNPPGWEYVERLLPFKTIPKLENKEAYPSGFVPPKAEGLNHPYFISRTKNHMLPIYLKQVARGAGKRSSIRRIEGDIWKLSDDVKAYLKEKHKKHIETSVNEFYRIIEVKGDHLLDLQNWAYTKGF